MIIQTPAMPCLARRLLPQQVAAAIIPSLSAPTVLSMCLYVATAAGLGRRREASSTHTSRSHSRCNERRSPTPSAHCTVYCMLGTGVNIYLISSHITSCHDTIIVPVDHRPAARDTYPSGLNRCSQAATFTTT